VTGAVTPDPARGLPKASRGASEPRPVGPVLSR